MATAALIRQALNDLETAQARGVELRVRIATINARIVELQGDLDAMSRELALITPDIETAEQRFKGVVAELDWARE